MHRVRRRLAADHPVTETSGTFVNCEGRVQSFNGVVRPLGEARPGWKVLRVLGSLLAVPGFDYDSSEEVRDEVLPAGEDFVDGLGNEVSAVPCVSWSLISVPGGLQRVAEVPIYSADLLARRAAALQKTHDALPPSARMMHRNPAGPCAQRWCFGTGSAGERRSRAHRQG
jgi:NADH-quinone oxidoreductase subunit G